jgi:hypothetical protein
MVLMSFVLIMRNVSVPVRVIGPKGSIGSRYSLLGIAPASDVVDRLRQISCIGGTT